MSTQSYNNSDSTVETSMYLPADIEGLTPEIVKKAEEELHETPEKREETLKDLKRRINGEKDFRPLMDDKFLLRFLRCRKFNAEAAFKTLKNFYTYKVRYSRVLTDVLPSEIEHLFDLNVLTVLPYRQPDGALVGVGKLGQFDLDKASINDLFASAIVCAEQVLQSEATQICGVTIVISLKGLSLRIIRHVASPTLIYRLVRAIQDCLPIRIKAVHIIHEPFYFNIFFNILRKLLSEKIRKRFQFHGNNLTNLHKQVPAEILPREFGGELGPLDGRDYAEKILAMDNHFSKLSKYGYQEKRAQFIRKKSSMAFGLFL